MDFRVGVWAGEGAVATVPAVMGTGFARVNWPRLRLYREQINKQRRDNLLGYVRLRISVASHERACPSPPALQWRACEQLAGSNYPRKSLGDGRSIKEGPTASFPLNGPRQLPAHFATFVRRRGRIPSPHTCLVGRSPFSIFWTPPPVYKTGIT